MFSSSLRLETPKLHFKNFQQHAQLSKTQVRHHYIEPLRRLTVQALDSTTVATPHPNYFKAVTHPLPTVTCFVPSLLPGSPIRVSLHSWTTPVASRATQSMAAQGSPVWFEAKVLLDGACTTYGGQLRGIFNAMSG